MIPVVVLIVITLVHFVSDFVLQTHEQASTKWNKVDALGQHVASYSLGITFGTGFLLWFISLVPIFHFQVAPPMRVTMFTLLVWGGINGVLHFITDYFTSKWVHRQYLVAPFKRTKFHDMFVLIGFDQFIHVATLIITWRYVPIPHWIHSL